MKKLSDVCLTIFAIGVICTLLAGAMSSVGYFAALVIGGEIATAICTFVFSTYLPLVIRFTSISVAIGLIGMYLSSQKALTVSLENKEEK